MKDVHPFPSHWLRKYNVEQLERLAIMTMDGGLTDEQAVKELDKQERFKEYLRKNEG